MSAPLTLRVHAVRVPLVRPFITAVRSATELETVLVEAVDADGRSGWGEAPISPVTGASTAGVTDAVEGPISELLQKMGPADPLELAARLSASSWNGATQMAVDCALYDLAAQQRGIPLQRLLGGEAGRVLTDMTLSVAEPAELAAAAGEHVDAGFTCIKVKLNAAGDPVQRLRAVRKAVGPAVRLRVDANQAFSADEAVRMVHEFEDEGLDVELVEQPVRAGAWNELASVTARVNTPIMADESVWTVEDVHQLIRHQAADLVNIKLAKTGGFHQALKVRTLAVEAGLGVMVGCMIESTVGIGAAACLASAIGSDRAHSSVPQDLDGGLWLKSSPVHGGARYEGNAIVLDDAAGLGITGLAQLAPSQ